VINTEGDVVFTLEHDVDYYSQFCDGYAFYLYSTDSMSKKSLDNIVSCIIDNEGNITYSSQNDDIRIILGYGNGQKGGIYLGATSPINGVSIQV